jgi:5-methylcytosine-specific restriction endonuclease McrBC GTP-binding regulatory subunit McrB
LKDYLKISEGINVKNIEAIKSGKKLVLPPNFHIFATMNTSDQSLFPMDSAFKRRWSWKYVPISAQKFQKDKQWKIKIDEDFSHEWGDFVEKINVKIAEITHSEDKQIGYFFCKANGDSCIDKETFVSKVVFYLWNDIFKDYGDNLLFKNKEGNLMFHDFFGDNGEIKTDIVEAFINNVFREK